MDVTFPLKAVNGMDYPEFISVFSPVVEHGTLAAACVWGARPFPDVPSISAAYTEFMHSLSPSCQKGLIRCYPDLAGTLSGEGKLSKESTLEQGSAGLLELTDSEKRELSLLNASYRDHFGFPFIVCARENKTETIKRELRRRRMENTAEEEVEVAINEICKIARYRIKFLVDCDDVRFMSNL